MTSGLIAASTLSEVLLVVFAAVIFLAMIVATAALIVWLVAGFLRATHP
jgi:hypothetical protein